MVTFMEISLLLSVVPAKLKAGTGRAVTLLDYYTRSSRWDASG